MFACVSVGRRNHLPSQVLFLLIPWTARSPGKVGEPEGVSKEPSESQGRIGTKAAPRLPPKFLSAWRLLAFISGCLWFPHGPNIPAWELGAASAQRHAKPIPWCACFHPSSFGWCQTVAHVACPVTSGNSRVWQRPFPRRLVSSRLRQTRVTGVGTSLGTGCSPPTLQRPICTTNQTTLPATLQPLCTV